MLEETFISFKQILFADNGEDDYTVACLLMVFIAIAIPRLVRTDSSAFKAAFEG